MTLQEAKCRGKKLRIALSRNTIRFEKKKLQLEKALRDLQKVCPHDLGRDEDRVLICAACGKEFV